ncbi:zinc-dependent MarR family transcriptional regulator [Streptococcus sp. zg-JUN1979]|uniref:zinc-dependent MarR family transcriptional regulator n=1 Tax=Streptococcus sp. zg-JUN1979 TaxID=3391450 RepID=UPI0039A47B11
MEINAQIDQLINQIVMRAENQHEFLLGACQSGLSLTNTQEHILMLLLDNGQLSNSNLAKSLSVSQAAVTKAVKPLLKQELVRSVKGKHDGRLVLLELTKAGAPIAKEHKHHHELTLAVYDHVLSDFSAQEQDVIVRFIKRVSEAIKE